MKVVATSPEAFVYLVKGPDGWWCYACLPGDWDRAGMRKTWASLRKELDRDGVPVLEERALVVSGGRGWADVLYGMLKGQHTDSGEMGLHHKTAGRILREALLLAGIAGEGKS